MIPALSVIVGAYVIFRALEIAIRSCKEKDMGGWSAVILTFAGIILIVVVFSCLGQIMTAGQQVGASMQPLQP